MTLEWRPGKTKDEKEQLLSNIFFAKTFFPIVEKIISKKTSNSLTLICWIVGFHLNGTLVDISSV